MRGSEEIRRGYERLVFLEDPDGVLIALVAWSTEPPPGLDRAEVLARAGEMKDAADAPFIEDEHIQQAIDGAERLSSDGGARQMPYAEVRDTRSWYELRGEGLPLLFISGSGGALWSTPGTLDPLIERFRMLAYDKRGLGRCEAPATVWEMADFADDAAALLDADRLGALRRRRGVVRRDDRAGVRAAASAARREARALLHLTRRRLPLLPAARAARPAARGARLAAHRDQRQPPRRRLAGRAPRGVRRPRRGLRRRLRRRGGRAPPPPPARGALAPRHDRPPALDRQSDADRRRALRRDRAAA